MPARRGHWAGVLGSGAMIFLFGLLALVKHLWYVVPLALTLLLVGGFFLSRANRILPLGLTRRLLSLLVIASFLYVLVDALFFVHARQASEVGKASLLARHVFTISGWYGRTGNTFVQIKTAARYAICCRGILRIPSHDVFTGMMAEYDFANVAVQPHANFKCASWSANFFVEPRLPYACTRDEDTYLRHIVLGSDIVPNATRKRLRRLEFEIDSRRFSCPANEDSLAIHFRSGDAPIKVQGSRLELLIR